MRTPPRKPDWLLATSSPRKIASRGDGESESSRRSKRRAPRGYDFANEKKGAAKEPTVKVKDTGATRPSESILESYDDYKKRFSKYEDSGWQPMSLSMKMKQSSKPTSPNVVTESLNDARELLQKYESGRKVFSPNRSKKASSDVVQNLRQQLSSSPRPQNLWSPSESDIFRSSTPSNQCQTSLYTNLNLQIKPKPESPNLNVSRKGIIETNPELDAIRAEIKHSFAMLDEVKDIHRVLFSFDTIGGTPEYDQVVESRAIQMTESAVSNLKKARERYKTYFQSKNEPTSPEPLQIKTEKDSPTIQQVISNISEEVYDDKTEQKTKQLTDKIENIALDPPKSTDGEENPRPSLAKSSTEDVSLPSEQQVDLFEDFDAKMSQIRSSLRAIAQADGISFGSPKAYVHEIKAETDKILNASVQSPRDSCTSTGSKSVESIMYESTKAVEEIANKYAKSLPKDQDPVSSLKIRADAREMKFNRLKAMLGSLSEK